MDEAKVKFIRKDFTNSVEASDLKIDSHKNSQGFSSKNLMTIDNINQNYSTDAKKNRNGYDEFKYTPNDIKYKIPPNNATHRNSDGSNGQANKKATDGFGTFELDADDLAALEDVLLNDPEWQKSKVSKSKSFCPELSKVSDNSSLLERGGSKKCPSDLKR